MDFTLTDEQQMLRDTARVLFAEECPSSLVRAACYDVTDDGPVEARRLFDRHLREWVALGDAPLVDLCLFHEEAGAAVAPGPTWVTGAFLLPLLRGAGHPDAERVAAGELTGTVAMCGPEGRWMVGAHDEKWFVPHVGEVDVVAFVLPGPSLLVAAAEELVVHPVDALDRSRPLSRVEVPGDRTGAVPLDAFGLQLALDRATVALSAELVGVARWLRETTLEYVRERVQFGRPVGSFQGLQWKLVDAALVHERAAASVYYAAMCVDADDADRRAAVHVAKATAGAAARRWARDGLQAHGGVGYTWEHDLHLRLRRAYGGDHLLGDQPWHHDRLADLIFR